MIKDLNALTIEKDVSPLRERTGYWPQFLTFLTHLKEGDSVFLAKENLTRTIRREQSDFNNTVRRYKRDGKFPKEIVFSTQQSENGLRIWRIK